MGVHGLWELLAPVGRRVSVETLAGKRLAVDASIWMVQFARAMRDESGEMVRGAHLLGFLRRICKLLFLRARPVFVFDGAAPPLKRRTLAARRRARDAAQAKIRKAAERLLLSHLKSTRLEELMVEIKNSRAVDDTRKGKQAAIGVADKSSNKGKQVATDAPEESSIKEFNDKDESDGGFGGRASCSTEQEKLDELLAFSLAAEEEGDFTERTSQTAANIQSEDHADVVDNSDCFDDEDEEMTFPVMTGDIDPAVLATLPPSIQLDLLVQMREKVMAENRQKYQKLKKAPAKFSELQIQSYLKTVAFRREIDEVQRDAAGRGYGGVQTTRVASEANREFIFSSSFTGDKQILATKLGSNPVGNSSTMKTSGKPDSSNVDKPNTSKASEGNVVREFGPDVETYRDDRGRVRVSRVRAFGIRMTRDIQRNLDFMKEFEQEKILRRSDADPQPTSKEEPKFPEHLFENEKTSTSFVSCENDTNTNVVDENHLMGEKSDGGNKEAIEISFLEDESENHDKDDQLFLHLASGSSSKFNRRSIQREQPVDDSDDSGDLWEEGVVDKDMIVEEDDLKQGHSSLVEKVMEDHVDWEEGVCDENAIATSSNQDYVSLSKGVLEEEALVQEAIRRSLEDLEKLETPAVQNISESNEDSGPFHTSANTSQPCLSPKSKPELRTMKAAADEQDYVQVHQLANKDEKTDLCKNYPEGQTVSPRSVGLYAAEPCEPVDLPVDALVKTASDGAPVDSIENLKHKHENTSEVCKIVLDTCPTQPSKSNLMSEKVVETFHDNDLTSDMATRDNVQRNIAKNWEENLPIFSAETDGKVSMDHQFEMSEAGIESEISRLRQEQLDLGAERKKLESHSESITSEMFLECQELLQMFGLPYIIAPMEAEAQCAYMEMNNLVDGVVTDDSDVFLFGARSVYKNIFDDRKYVETYFMKDIESELGLSREKLIRMALLLGSDYTEGVSGIGIVNAIEVVNAFPEEDGLQKFRDWVESPDLAILGKLTVQPGNSKKKSSKSSGNNATEIASEAGRDDVQSSNVGGDVKEIFMRKHRNVSKNWHLPPSFPSDTVVSAYISPAVDDSKESFTWGRPDLSLLQKLCWERFGWNKEKSDELFLPVLKEYNKHETQLRLEAFYSFNERFAKVRSQRIKKAIKGLTGGAFPNSEETVQDCSVGISVRSNKRCGSKGRSSAPGRGRKRNNDRKPTTSEGEALGVNDSSSPRNDSFGDNTEISETMENSVALRRSKRRRKQVNYAVDNPDTGDTEVLDQTGDDNLSGSVEEQRPSGVSFHACGLILSPEKDGDTVNDRSCFHSPQQDYLGSGGGFCRVGDGMEVNSTAEAASVAPGDQAEPATSEHPGVSPNHLSEDYLFAGRVFWNTVDAEEGGNVTSEAASVAAGQRQVKADLSSGDLSINSCNSEELSQQNEQPSSRSVGGKASFSFSGMPVLRRKRRKA